MGKEDADGYVRVKIDVDTSQEKEIKRSLEDIQDDADNAKRKLDALKDAGVDDIIAEKQRQLDEWRSEQN